MRGILLTAYGTPRTLDDVEEYYTHIRGGRKPSPEQLEDLISRYKSIGGTSPLIEITEAQRSKLQVRLREGGMEARVFAGMKHSPPFISEVVKEAAESGVDTLLTIALAPHYSTISIGSYINAVTAANQQLGSSMRLEFVKSWHDNPGLISMWSGLVKAAAGKVEAPYALVCSAHSLPARIISQGDPYRDELLHTSELVAGRSGSDDWSFTFQSASATGEPWLAPDILDHLESLSKAGKRSFVLAPLGFVSDHLEILYDIDVECRRWAEKAGIDLVRCDSPNDSDALIDCLYSVASGAGQ